MEEVGVVTHYFSKIGVAVIKVSGELSVGESLHFKGATTDFSQKLESMQVEHENIEKAKPGDDIGLKTAERVREGDKVFKE